MKPNGWNKYGFIFLADEIIQAMCITLQKACLFLKKEMKIVQNSELDEFWIIKYDYRG